VYIEEQPRSAVKVYLFFLVGFNGKKSAAMADTKPCLTPGIQL